MVSSIKEPIKVAEYVKSGGENVEVRVEVNVCFDTPPRRILQAMLIVSCLMALKGIVIVSEAVRVNGLATVVNEVPL